jgi:hypothetical protein
MSKQLLTIGIVLSLGTVGCAGFGVQQGSSLTAQFSNEQGLDDLWNAREEVPTEGLEAPAYAEQGLGNLWNAGEKAKSSGGVIGSYADQSLGNLWHSAL